MSVRQLSIRPAGMEQRQTGRGEAEPAGHHDGVARSGPRTGHGVATVQIP